VTLDCLTPSKIQWYKAMKDPKNTTEPGYVNQRGQVVIRNTGYPGTDKNAKMYQLGCSLCGYVYGANGQDIFERRCPRCQHGEAGLGGPMLAF
jgi:hypothetical protein